MNGDIFVDGEFTSHSGLRLPFKIDCDALSDSDLDTLAVQIMRRSVRFGAVYGVPRGRIRLVLKLERYATRSALDPLLIVDDVLTTGHSMHSEREKRWPTPMIGAVIFARGPCPAWVTPLFIESARS